MRRCFIVTGTNTGIGKTVFSAGLVRFLNGAYWKPVQAGLDGETDFEAAQRLSGLPEERFLPEVYRLRTPSSPHSAAERDGIEIDVDRLVPPHVECPLIIEGAGGLMVPLTSDKLLVDVFAQWGAPVILCASSELGTINHSLLSLEALSRRQIPVQGIAFIGNENANTERTIVEMGHVRRLGRLPRLNPLDATTLKTAFEASFDRADFLAEACS